MANITNNEVVAFVNDQIRPLCEELRNLKVKIAAMGVTWFSGINANVPNDRESPLMDGRASEGVSRLNGADINNAVGQLLNCSDANFNVEIISKPCVRVLRTQ